MITTLRSSVRSTYESIRFSEPRHKGELLLGAGVVD